MRAPTATRPPRSTAILMALAVTIALASPVVASAVPVGSASGGSAQAAEATLTPAAAVGLPGKLRADLAALVSGDKALDPRIPNLVAGYRSGEIPYFAVLSEPNDAAHRAVLEGLGARVLRSYRSVTAYALASDPTTVLRVAALPWVAWMAPVEVVVALDEPVADQTRGTPQDVGAPQEWAAGVTGSGVRIAILDTGIDAAHPDLDDQDFRHWSSLSNSPKVVDARNFTGGQCAPLAAQDGHGHGTHVAGIAAGTGEGTPLASDNGRYAGIAPDAELAVAKVLTDAGAGLNSDLVAAMEWAAMPADPANCAIGAEIVNLSLGSEARPDRLNSDSDVDFVGTVLDHLAVAYGTLFVVAAGNSGPFVGSVLEAPGSAAQALSVAATAKDYDLNHDDTLSGDTCAGYLHPRSTSFADNDCRAGTGTQGPSISSFSSRGPSGDVWLRPDIAAPGYNIVSAQSSTGAAIASNDLAINTRGDPLYATATGTSMAAPATAGSAALLLQAYRAAYGRDPTGASGISGMSAPRYALLRAALMNSARADLLESRWILTTDLATRLDCPNLDPLDPSFCQLVKGFTDIGADGFGSLTLDEVRNGATDPYVGPLAEGAGKLSIPAAVAALLGGLVMYSTASGSGADAGTGHRDFQGSWQIGPIDAGASQRQAFVLHAAPNGGPLTASFSFEAGRPSDGSHAIPFGAQPGAWSISLPGPTSVSRGGDSRVELAVSVPPGTPPGAYTGVVRVTTSAGQVLRVPVFASVALHDPDPTAGNAPGPQAVVSSDHDVFAKDDTTWPSALGTPGTGANADWLVYPVDLAAGLSQVRFSVYDAAAGDETYDLYLYDSRLDLAASTHPFAADGVTDVAANDRRPASTPAAPQVLTVRTPAAGRHYLAVNRARIGGTTRGDFGAFRLTVDEIGEPTALAPSAASYDGDYLLTQGSAAHLTAHLTDAAGAGIAGRTLTFTIDGVSPCGGGCSASTDYTGRAQVATDPISLPAGVHEVAVAFAGDQFWAASAATAFALVVGAGAGGDAGTGGKVTAGGWFVPEGAASTGTGNGARIHVAFSVESASGAAPTGALRYRDQAAGIDLTLVDYIALVVEGTDATLTGTARRSDGTTLSFALTAHDGGEPGKGHDTLRMQLLDGSGYDRSGTLGGGNLQVH